MHIFLLIFLKPPSFALVALIISGNGFRFSCRPQNKNKKKKRKKDSIGCKNTKSVQKYAIYPCAYARCIYIYIYIYIRGSLNKFPDFFRMGTFIDSTHRKFLLPSKKSPPAAMHLYHSHNFCKTPWKSSCVSVSVTFVTASFISPIVS